MHRLATLAGDSSPDEFTLVEQPPASVLFISSASTDIATLSSAMSLYSQKDWKDNIRGLCLSSLEHPAQIDHYLSTTAKDADLIFIRLLGGKGHWSYGLERCKSWNDELTKRNLIVVSGTKEHEIELHSIGDININLVKKISLLLNNGGIKNMSILLDIFRDILDQKEVNPKEISIHKKKDPEKWEWRNDPGSKIGVLLYSAMLHSGDIELAREINNRLRKNNLCPRTLWVTSLRDDNVKKKVEEILEKECIKAVITSTSFATVEFNEASIGSPLWEKLDVPVFQALTSSQSRDSWLENSIGLTPLDLTMQIALPEVDGRILTRPCGFKEYKEVNQSLATGLQVTVPDYDAIDWLAMHVKSWVDLQKKEPSEKKICLVIANYPVRNGRIANGVGLDTPESTVQILKWLKETGHYLGENQLPKTSKDLMQQILSSRTNDPESIDKYPLDYLSLDQYYHWWNNLPNRSKQPILNKWGKPEDSRDLEKNGFAIHGVEFGNVCLLIQPSRSYDYENKSDLHSPYLSPPHRYLAQYLWLRKKHNSQIIIHVGKHGSLEWLPGKGVGLSKYCYPHIAIGHLPHIYPFIVNDPGEGSQAKRRSQAVIIDHLTPPLGLSGLHGDLLAIESLLDEYYESISLSQERSKVLEKKIMKLIEKNSLSDVEIEKEARKNSNIDIQKLFLNVESYLCEIKESQIRTGLHIFGKELKHSELYKLIFLISKSPTINHKGVTQQLAEELDLEIDPWSCNEGDFLQSEDIHKMSRITNTKFKLNGDIISWLDEQAYLIIKVIVDKEYFIKTSSEDKDGISTHLKRLFKDSECNLYKYICNDILPKVSQCSIKEKENFLKAINGKRVQGGPSGSPTRGRVEVLPTGRNFYSVDLRSMPTEAAWDLGLRSANNLIDLHLMETGEPLRKLAMSVWGTSTMRNGGEDICQLFALLGIKPIWDGPTRRVVDLEVIPLSILDRPRVDVFLRISGLFRDAFPHLIKYVNKAQKLIASLNEPQGMNPLSVLSKKGLSISRVYGSAPGAYGAGLQNLIDNSAWDNRSDLADAYLSWSHWRYDDCDVIVQDKKGLKESLKDVQVVLHNQDNREHDLLDSDDYYQFHGGLAAAVEKISDEMPIILFGDNSRRERPKIHKISKEIDKVMRTRMLNPKWIEGIKKHGYKGAFEMGASLDYLFAYDASTGAVPNWCYTEICRNWLADKNTQNFLRENNPWVLRDMAERLLEANNRNIWTNAKDNELIFLRKLVNESESDIEHETFKSY